MKITQRFEKRLQEAKQSTTMALEVIRKYCLEIELEQKRQRTSSNSFVKTCCQQTIDQLTAEKKEIEYECM